MSEEDILRIFKGNLSPSIADVIKVRNRPQDLSEVTGVKFRMRDVEETTLVVNGDAKITSPSDGAVAYDWQAGDTDVAGEFAAWWTIVVSPGVEQDTPEFRLDIVVHQPGLEVRTGAIFEWLTMLLPATVAGMRKQLGDDKFQQHIDVVKSILFGEVVPAGDEDNTYSIEVIMYAAKVSAMRLIPAAIDWWGDQPLNVSAQGTNESLSFPDRRDQLWKVYERLRYEVLPKKLEEVDGTWKLTRRGSRSGGPAVRQPSSVNKVTVNPADFPKINERLMEIWNRNWTEWS